MCTIFVHGTTLYYYVAQLRQNVVHFLKTCEKKEDSPLVVSEMLRTSSVDLYPHKANALSCALHYLRVIPTEEGIRARGNDKCWDKKWIKKVDREAV